MAYKNSLYAPRQDTGWGLIYRLNRLMDKIEMDIENGDLNKWNVHIDRIFANILYKNPAEILLDEKGKVLDIQFSQEDIQVFTRLNKLIEEIKKKKTELGNLEDDIRKRKIKELNDEHYAILWKKDVWLRKRMYKLDLYLKQADHDPRRAIYGG
jgi:hypothetical protein